MRISDWSSDVCSSDRAESQIVYANPAAENLLENSSKRLVGQCLRDLFINNEELVSVFTQALQHQFADQRLDLTLEIGRASCRERVCQLVVISVDTVSLNK